MNPIDVKQQNEQGNFALHLACKFEHTKAVIMKLIELCPAAVRTMNGQRNFPLHLACRYNQSEAVIMKLIELYPTAVQETNHYGLQPFQLACSYIRSEKSTPAASMEAKSFKFPDSLSGSYLHVACKKGQSDTVVKKIIELNPMLLQRQDSEGLYPIDCALRSRQTNAVIIALIDADRLAMQRQTNPDQKSPLHFVCRKENVTLGAYMMQRSGTFINLKDSDGSTPLHIACDYGRFEVEEKLLWHSENDCLDCFNEMLENMLQHPYIDVNCIDNVGETPLHKATRTKSLVAVDKLLNHPCILINQKNYDNQTPLDIMKQTIHELEMLDNLFGTLQLPLCKEIMRFLEEFPIARRWNSYQYFLSKFVD